MSFERWFFRDKIKNIPRFDPIRRISTNYEEIRDIQKNSPNPQWLNCDSEENDYCEQGVCEVVGLRPTQEDVVVRAKLAGFNTLTPETQKRVMTEAVAEMQVSHGNHPFTGSTACMTVSWMEEKDGKRVVKYCNANVGDSVSFLVVLDANNKIVTKKQINTIHRTPDDKPCGNLQNLNRTIGDTDSERAGLKHTPEIVTGEIALAKGQRAFIITACDGLTEAMDRLYLEAYRGAHDGKGEYCDIVAKWVKEAAKSKPFGINLESYIAFKLVGNALFNSGDNISVIAREVTSATTSDLDAVFDGHGGKEVSYALGQNAEKILREKLLDALPPRRPSFLTRIGHAIKSMLQWLSFGSESYLEFSSSYSAEGSVLSVAAPARNYPTLTEGRTAAIYSGLDAKIPTGTSVVSTRSPDSTLANANEPNRPTELIASPFSVPSSLSPRMG